MNKFKKIGCALLAVTVMASFGACAKSNDSVKDNNNTQVEKTTQAKQVEYYEEESTLPTVDSSVDATYTGKSTTTSVGKTTKIVYKYTFNEGTQISDYLTAVEAVGFSTEASENGYAIVKDEYIVANIEDADGIIQLNIIPTDARTMSASSAKIINEGDKIVSENYTFTLNKVELTYEVKPKNTSSVYTSYSAEDGKVYIHVDGTYENHSKKDVCIRDLPTPTADYNDGFTYDGFAIVDDGDNSFDWVSSYVICEPLTSCHYHGLIECPEEVDKSDKPLYVLITLGDGVTYRYNIR